MWKSHCFPYVVASPGIFTPLFVAAAVDAGLDFTPIVVSSSSPRELFCEELYPSMINSKLAIVYNFHSAVGEIITPLSRRENNDISVGSP